jgi:predicted MPP superfamily phosphohydrolase
LRAHWSLLDRAAHALLRRPYRDEDGRKGWLEWFSRAQPHITQRVTLTIDGWPRFNRPLRIVFLSDFHVGSHARDVARLAAIVAEAGTLRPDLALFGGDYVNMQLFGGGRVPPHVIATLLAPLRGTCGRFAILGNHDYVYGEHQVAAALRDQGIKILDHERATVTFDGHVVEILGLPDAHCAWPQGRTLLGGLSPDRPAIILTHDPAWFSEVPAGPFLTLAGHTHGGQVRLPGLGIVTNASKAPLRWSHGTILETGRHLHVSAGLGTSSVPIRMGVPPEFTLLEVSGRKRT